MTVTDSADFGRMILNELAPEAERLLARHLSVAQEWFPHEYVPYRLGRDFDPRPCAPPPHRLTGVANTRCEITHSTGATRTAHPPRPRSHLHPNAQP